VKPVAVFLCAFLATTAYAYSPYTVLDADQYRQTVSASRNKVTKILQTLTNKHRNDADTQIALIVNQLADIPYLHNGMGEGDWQPKSPTYRSGAIHTRQNPVYRLDGLNCQTLVQVAMALYHSNQLSQFDKNYLKIAYGAMGNPQGEIVHYYNRNNFIDADFNPVNQRHGWLKDVTSKGVLSPYSKKIHATITKQKWFIRQRYHRAENIQVLSDSSGQQMLDRYKNVYSALPFPNVNEHNIVMSYLPKETLALRQEDDSFKPNQKLLDKIPTPAILEIVRDPNRWNDFGIKIKDIIGSELTVSHLGLLYRQTFKRGQLIYRKISCSVNAEHKQTCSVTAITCQKKSCRELMFAHATNAHHQRYYWYQQDGQYSCSPKKPGEGQPYTTCNRVVSLPFYDYLTDYQLGYYTNMDVGSILGVHIEKLEK
jgi:hypothetical protein